MLLSFRLSSTVKLLDLATGKKNIFYYSTIQAGNFLNTRKLILRKYKKSRAVFKLDQV